MQLNILIVSNTNPESTPRPNRMIKCFLENNHVTVLGKGCVPPGCKYAFYALPRRTLTVWDKIKNLVELKKGNYEKYLASQIINELPAELKSRNFDLIICHDLLLLPAVLNAKKSASVLFDAREFYPTHFNSSILWRFFYKKLNNYLCGQYLGQVDSIITVSNGLAQLYEEYYGVQPQVVQSWPEYEALEPTEVNSEKIKIVHHGNAKPVRKLELMIQLMDYVDERFRLDMYLVNVDKKYFEYLKGLAARRNNVTIKTPIAYGDLIKELSHYDIGIFLVPPVTDNLKFVLPNKFFEFVQARLAIAVGPSPEMKEIVEEFDLGVVSSDFDPKSLAKKLNSLTTEKITLFKKNSNVAAGRFNAKQNCKRLKEIVAKGLCD